MINEFDKVRFIGTCETGIVVDIRNTASTFYLVEKDTDNELVDCTKDEIELMDFPDETS